MARESMRILMLYGPGEIAKELSRRGNKVLAVCCDIEGPLDEKFADYLSMKSVSGRQKLSPTAVLEVRRLIIEFQPDIIHAYTNFSLSWVNLATICLPSRIGVPRVHSFRGTTGRLHSLDPANWLTFRNPRVAAHVCESEAVRQAMLDSHVNAPEDSVVYNCVPQPQNPLTREQARAELRLPNDVFLVGSIATIRRVKGLDILLQAACLFDDPNTHFVVIGPGGYREFDLLAKSQRLKNRLHLTGGIHDAKRFLPALDLFVMPSRAEGLCRALIEAMQQGLASVVSDAGGMKELVRNAIDGFVVERENPDALFRAIEQLRHDEDLRHRMGRSAMDRVKQICDPKVVVDKLLKIYERSLG